MSNGPCIPLLVRRGGCGIKKISAKPTLAPQTGWSLTSHVRCERPPLPHEEGNTYLVCSAPHSTPSARYTSQG